MRSMTLRISRILHAGYLFECEGTTVLFDPIFENPFSSNCHAFPSVRFDLDQIRALRPAAVFLSHLHDDHCSFDSLDLLDRSTPIYLYCLFEELFDMIRTLGFTQVHKLATNVAIQAGPFSVTPREAFDSDVDAMFQIRAADMNILNVVDAWIEPEIVDQLAGLGPWDMVLWPFQTMLESDVLAPTRAAAAADTLPAEWFDQLGKLNPRYVVPSACQFVQEPWSWYNHAMFPVTYRQFARELGAALPAIYVVRLNPSVSIDIDSGGIAAAPALPWVIPVGGQDVDFAYDPLRVTPPTSAIARHFPALGGDDTALVIAFCRHGLLDTYRDMELPDDSYFAKPRGWRLRLYDHAGSATEFVYRIEGDTIDSAGAGEVAIAWSTDVPIAKVHAALTRGESLTSMYVRINDDAFDATTEAEIVDADLIDDPLIRCLFNGAVGSYQAAQLKRILARNPTAPGVRPLLL